MGAIGSIIADKYRVDALLGEGAMGSVVAATHLELDKRVAIKLVKSDVAHPAGLDRFVQEARGVAKLRNEHICQVTDFGRLADGSPFIVMEMLDGETLEERFARGRLHVGEIARYLVEICEALDEAHAAGIVHRDLKPGNLFRVRKSNGTVHLKVLDFGVSKFQREASAFATTDFAVIGTPAYMSPEQLRSSRDVDARSDVWALGVVMYQALAGELPFSGEAFLSLCTAIASEPPRQLRGVRPDLDPVVEQIVLRCLEKNPAARFPSVVALSRALAPLADSVVPWDSTGPASVPTIALPVSTTLGAAAAESVRVSRRGRAPLVVGGSIALAIITIIAVASIQLARRRTQPAVAPIPAIAATPVDAVTPVDAARDAPIAAVADGTSDAGAALDAGLAKRVALPPVGKRPAPHVEISTPVAPRDAGRRRCATDDPECAFAE